MFKESQKPFLNLSVYGLSNHKCTDEAYMDLIGMFPEENQGEGIEPRATEMAHQPMTYALVLSSEVFRFRSCSNEESQRRIRLAVSWLVSNADLDGDGRPGWGLPQAWDAFQDGSVNPENQPYTITTAMVMEALLEALDLPSFWSTEESSDIVKLLVQVSKRWMNDAWTEDVSGGYFWYSTNSNDAHFVINVSAMFLGNLARLLGERPEAFTTADRYLVQDRIDKAAQGVIGNVTWRNGRPYWIYGLTPPQSVHPNDLLHHGYIIWGMELYRHYNNKVLMPWSTKHAIESLSSFRKEGVIYDYPQDVWYDNDLYLQPAILWSTGMMLALEARWGSPQRASRDLEIIDNHYGPIPDLRLFPMSISDDNQFYARYAAHVLWGMAVLNYSERVFQIYIPFDAK